MGMSISEQMYDLLESLDEGYKQKKRIAFKSKGGEEFYASPMSRIRIPSDWLGMRGRCCRMCRRPSETSFTTST